MMRFTCVSIAAALAFVSVSASVSGQRPDAQIDPRSTALLEQGRTARGGGDLPRAIGLAETALAVDPRNRAAFVFLAEVARQQDLPGKAIRHYREALLLEPNDLAALRGQGEALVAKGAVTKARENLAKVRTICGGDCEDATKLAAVIQKGPPVTATAQAAPAPSATPTARQ